jgi:DNA-binding HxlR family transcriptional regulator
LPTGLIVAKPYQERPLRRAYELTEKGRGLGGVPASLARWGKRHVPGTRIPPEFRKPRGKH